MRRLLASPRALLCLAFVWASGCGGTSRHPPSGTGTGTSSGGGTTGFTQAPHSPLPQLTYQGGALISAPKIVTVTFAGDANAAALEAFDDDLVTSTWWSTVISGFCNDSGVCVGQGTSGGHVELTSPAAPSYTDATGGGASTLQLFLEDQIARGILPATDSNTLYVLYFPSSTQISLAQKGAQAQMSCQQLSGYHNAFKTTTGSATPYVVVPECAPATGSALSPIQSITFAASHEILEAATDPVQTTRSLGYYLNLSDSSVLGWNLLFGGEAGDLCVDVTHLGQDVTTVDGYTVQRTWSNANAGAGLDPCVPTPARGLYFNVAPSGKNAFLVLDVGGSATFEADAFSSGRTTPWTLSGVDWATEQHQIKSPLLSFTFNGQKTVPVNNGDKIEVTVTLDGDPGQLGGAEGVLFSVAGTPTAPTAAHMWPVLIVTPAEADGGA